jgi:hypothetical protein
VSWQACQSTTSIGNIWGPHLSGTIDYASGTVSLTFASGYAPASGASVTANYVANGWGIGAGLLDEDGRNTSWVGNDSVYLTGANASFKADADDFLYQMAKYYFQNGKTHTLAHFNKVVAGWTPLYLGPGALCYWNTPPHRSVLKAASETLDLISVVGYPMSQDRLDFIYRYAGDRPLINGIYYTANADSAMWRYPDNDMAQPFLTQQARGAGYGHLLLGTGHQPGMLNAFYSASAPQTYPYVGVVWWEYLDTPGENANWGLVTLSDNAYDGREAVYTDGNFSRTARCSAPIHGYSCGGEERSYGDLIGGVSEANSLLQAKICHQLGGCAVSRSSTLSEGQRR